MDDSEFEEDIYDAASPYDVPSDGDLSVDLHDGYISDSSSLFVADHHDQLLDDFVDDHEQDLDFDDNDGFGFDLPVEYPANLLANERLERIFDASIDPDHEDFDQDLADIVARTTPAQLERLDRILQAHAENRPLSPSPAGSDYSINSEFEELVAEAEAQDEDRIQFEREGSLAARSSVDNEDLAALELALDAAIPIDSDDDSDIFQSGNHHSPASDDLYILASPSVAGAASAATSQSSNSAPHPASRLGQGSSTNNNFRPPSSGLIRPASDRSNVPQQNRRRRFPSFGPAEDDLLEIEIAERQPNLPLTNGDRHRPRQDLDLFIDDSEDELIMMDFGHSRRANAAPARIPAGNAVIDLTEEPDSPVLAFAPPPPRPASGNNARANPRRSHSLNHRTPSLSRSDGSILAGPSFIDLTDDSPDDYRPALPLPRRAGGGPQAMAQQQAGNNQAAEADEDVSFLGVLHRHSIGRLNEYLPNLFGQPPPPPANPPAAANRNNRHRRHHANHRPHPLGMVPRMHAFPEDALAQILNANPLENFALNYQHNGFHQMFPPAAAPKPDFMAPEPAREGFTRDTGGDDKVPVCASCEEELQFDADDDGIGQPPAKRARSKKDREEHHFWALLDCGHVYCKRCYENRKGSVPKANGKRSLEDFSYLKFRKVSGGKKDHIHCAVDDCNTNATEKTKWVGLFL